MVLGFINENSGTGILAVFFEHFVRIYDNNVSKLFWFIHWTVNLFFLLLLLLLLVVTLLLISFLSNFLTFSAYQPCFCEMALLLCLNNSLFIIVCRWESILTIYMLWVCLLWGVVLCWCESIVESNLMHGGCYILKVMKKLRIMSSRIILKQYIFRVEAIPVVME